MMPARSFRLSAERLLQKTRPPWCLFTSGLAINNALSDRATCNALKTCRIAVLSETAKRRFTEQGLQVSFVASSPTAADLASELIEGELGADPGRWQTIFYFRGNSAGSELPALFTRSEHRYREYVVYKLMERKLTEIERCKLAELLTERSPEEQRLRFLICSDARSLALLSDAIAETQAATLIYCSVYCIGPKSFEVANELGFEKVFLAENRSISGMVSGIISSLEED